MKSEYMRLALSLAHRSTSRYRLCAVAVRKNRVLSIGFNRMGKTHPVMQRFNKDPGRLPGIHAEVQACLGVDLTDLHDVDLYVARVTRNEEAALAKPCEICQAFLQSVGVRQVGYSDKDGWRILNLRSA